METPSKEQKKVLRAELKTYASLEAIANSDGGKVLIKGLKKDTVSAIDVLISQFRTAPEIELRAACASLRERITLLRAFTRASKNRKFTQGELDELLTLDNDDEDGND
jgi:hypothetical protein